MDKKTTEYLEVATKYTEDKKKQEGILITDIDLQVCFGCKEEVTQGEVIAVIANALNKLRPKSFIGIKPMMLGQLR